MSESKIHVLFVCLGNICRSPLAEAIFRLVVTEERLEDRFVVDSAGTSSYHIGDPPDRRSAEVAARRGVTVEGSARQLEERDLVEFDYVIAMDRSNYHGIESLAAGAGLDARLHLLREFDPEADDDAEVPDPYFGGPRGFQDVHDIVERSCRGLLRYIRHQEGIQ